MKAAAVSVQAAAASPALLFFGVLEQKLQDGLALFVIQARPEEHALRDAEPLLLTELARIAGTMTYRAALVEDALSRGQAGI
ncbi:hypothetical protein [Cupriavidus sp. RAF12]|uniref:hypothetical protein n=1 Tax=Cupriavidus sp. RAF12 TaxID=3233050 RepID=UPI003F8FB40D